MLPAHPPPRSAPPARCLFGWVQRQAVCCCGGSKKRMVCERTGHPPPQSALPARCRECARRQRQGAGEGWTCKARNCACQRHPQHAPTSPSSMRRPTACPLAWREVLHTEHKPAHGDGGWHGQGRQHIKWKDWNWHTAQHGQAKAPVGARQANAFQRAAAHQAVPLRQANCKAVHRPEHCYAGANSKCHSVCALTS